MNAGRTNSLLEAPLAEKSRSRHIRLAIQPRYLGNYVSHINSYYELLSGSHGRSFKIHHEKVRAAPPPPGGGLTMTLYPFAIKPRYLGNHASQIKTYY